MITHYDQHQETILRERMAEIDAYRKQVSDLLQMEVGEARVTAYCLCGYHPALAAVEIGRAAVLAIDQKVMPDNC